MLRTAFLASAAFAAAAFAVPAAAQSLRPDQEAALTRLLADLPPEMRLSMRPQLAASLALMNEAQIALFMQSFEDEGADDDGSADKAEDVDAPAELSPEDLAYNRAQYAPAIEAAWRAQKDFDDFVNAALAESCPDHDDFAVFGPAFRYDLYPLQPSWPTASDSPDIDVAVLGGSYAPQDGRYDFDFSGVRHDFDQRAVRDAVTAACADYARIGARFKAEIGGLVAANDHDAAYRRERAYGEELNPIRERLEAVLKEQAPSGDYALFNALMNATRVE